MDIQLLIHNVGSVISAMFSFGLAVFTYFNNPKRTANIMLGLTMAAVGVFYASHVVGINLTDPLASRAVFMLNLSIIFISVFSAHTALAVIGIEHKRKRVLEVMYAVSFVLLVFYIMYPDMFLELSRPKLFFPNYYEAGASYHWIMRLIYNFIIPTYFLTEMLLAYRKADFILKNRLKYFFLAMLLGYSTGFILVLPVFNIFVVNPNWGLFFIFFYAIPFVYAVVNYELLDIRLVAKKAFVYGLTIAAVSAIIGFLSFGSSYVERTYPAFPIWVIPVAAAIVASGIGAFVWRRIKETEVLRYEFVNIVTHKFRHPLTYIKWAAGNLKRATGPSEHDEAVRLIERANARLFELTETLLGVTEAERSSYQYRYTDVDLPSLAAETLKDYAEKFAEKHIAVSCEARQAATVRGDAKKLSFLFQVLMENALTYGNPGGTVSITFDEGRRSVTVTLTDSGIGIKKEDLKLVGQKFFRAENARRAFTEGLGIGLYVSSNILRRHGGKLTVESDGVGKGARFAITLPKKK